MMMEQIFNPWPGTATYQDPQSGNGGFMFCGRVNETIDMVRLIDNNLFVTLYGPTGVGKSSLLNAGVFPRLRKLSYFPISIRFSEEDPSIPFAKILVNKIQSSGLVTSANVKLDNDDPESIVYLWKYFTTTSFKDKDGKDGKEIYPVFVFDQFEEIFFDKNNKENTEKAKLFLQQIYALLDDYLIVPQEPGYSDSTNYRFVATIREDDLCVLEDVIDECQLQSMKNNRYRLKELSPEKAADIIRLPGKEYKCIDDAEIDDVADQIVDLARNENGTISSLMISLLCNRLFAKGHGKITSKLVEEKGQTTLKDYCKEFLKDWEDNDLEKFCELLITDDGRRKKCNKSDLGEIPAGKVSALFGKDSRLLEVIKIPNSEPQVEIIHDKFAAILPTVISEIKAERAKENADRAEKMADKAQEAAVRAKEEADQAQKDAQDAQDKAMEANKRAKRRKWLLWIFIPAFIIAGFFAWLFFHKYLNKVETGKDLMVQIVFLPDESLEGYDWEAGVVFDLDSALQVKRTINDTVCYVRSNDTVPVGARIDKQFFSDTINLIIPRKQLESYSSVGMTLKVIPQKLCKEKTADIALTWKEKTDTSLTMITRTITLTRSEDAVFKFKGTATINDIPIRDAIVVLDDHVVRTDENGEFKFYLNDSSELKGQSLYVLKNEFKPFEILGDSILKRLSKDKDYFFTMGSIKLALRDEFSGYNGLLKTQQTIYKYYEKYGSTDSIQNVLQKADSVRLNRYNLLGGNLSVGKFMTKDSTFYFIRKTERSSDYVLGYLIVKEGTSKQFSGTLKKVEASRKKSKQDEWNVDLSAFDNAYNREHITGVLSGESFQITQSDKNKK